MNKDNYKTTAFVMMVCEIALTASFVFPLYLVEGAGTLRNALMPYLPGIGSSAGIGIIYSVFYTLLFSLLFFNKGIRRDWSYCLFSFIHFCFLSTILFLFFAPMDGQSIFLIYGYCLFSALLSLPLARLWVTRAS
ncbi:MAG: hypothetical protein KA149_02985 [Chitinophagales bacterium]|nr:hypothetical protein [Chitinophagales bacterium]